MAILLGGLGAVGSTKKGKVAISATAAWDSYDGTFDGTAVKSLADSTKWAALSLFSPTKAIVSGVGSAPSPDRADVRIVNIASKVVTFGSVVTLAQSGLLADLNLVGLSDGDCIACYYDDVSGTQRIVGNLLNISGDTITVNTQQTINNTNTVKTEELTGYARGNGDDMIAAWMESNSDDDIHHRIINKATGTTLGFGTELLGGSSAWSEIGSGIVSGSTDNFVSVVRDSGNRLDALLYSIDGSDNITLETTDGNLDGGSTVVIDPMVIGLTTTKSLCVYRRSSDTNTRAGYLTIDTGAPSIAETSWSNIDTTTNFLMNGCRIDDERAMIVFADGTDVRAVVVKDVAGVATVMTERVLATGNAASSERTLFACPISDTEILTVFSDPADSFHQYVQVLATE